jgi:hypothetical protein
MRVCLVGNGFSPAWKLSTGPEQSRFIDSCEIVVRMNWCQHYYFGWTGWKTDILLLRSAADAGTGGRMLAEYDVTIPYGVARGANRVMVYAASHHDTRETAIAPYLPRYNWTADRMDLLSHDYEQRTRDACGASDKYSMISLGTLATFWALETYPSAAIYLAGFAFGYMPIQDTQTIHDYAAERDWILRVEKEGRLAVMP